jgi:hypothetical protein
MPPNFPAIERPQGLQRATATVSLPEPEHHHLPAWVRRAHALARPILADELAALSGDPRSRLEQAIAQLVAVISSGKFSQAFRYRDVIELGDKLLTQQRVDQAEQQRRRRALDSARRRVSERLQDGGARLPQEVSSRLSRTLKSATDLDEIAAVGAELETALESARSVEDRRRDREIDRTRRRIQRSTPRAAASTDGPEDWQDVLRRLQEQMAGTEQEA